MKHKKKTEEDFKNKTCFLESLVIEVNILHKKTRVKNFEFENIRLSNENKLIDLRCLTNRKKESRIFYCCCGIFIFTEYIGNCKKRKKRKENLCFYEHGNAFDRFPIKTVAKNK